MARVRGPSSARYEFGGVFDAPLPFVYRWCLDYRPDDAKLSGEKFERKILDRSARTVVYEDLEEGEGGWRWSRIVVTKRPPNRWHADIRGSHRSWSLDYELDALPDGRTRLRARGVRTRTAIGEPNPSRRTLERELREMWEHYGRALEKDYRTAPRRR